MLQVRVALPPGATSVANDCTRGSWVVGVNEGTEGAGAVDGGLVVDHVIPCAGCVGLATAVPPAPRPPPSCPTIVSEVGTPPTELVNWRWLVSCRVSVVPAELYGTVMTTGDHAPVVAFGFRDAQVGPPAVAAMLASQVYPHIGIALPSGIVAVAGAAISPTAAVVVVLPWA